MKWIALFFLFLSTKDVFSWLAGHENASWGMISLISALIWAFIFSSYWHWDQNQAKKQ